MARMFVVGLALAVLAADRPVPPDQAAQRFRLPDGFRATLFAGEPDIVQPIAFTFDDRGRAWVVECLSYPKWTTDKTGHDRVTILEDTNNDGHFDKKTVFYDKGSNLSGIALGFGGVWLCSTPDLIFIPDRDGDDRPDGPPEIVLDGWNLQARHNVFNALTWGPDGWLWGLNGIIGEAVVGPPGMPAQDRKRMTCGVWRYHPTRKVFEPIAHGTTNPWGLDFDDYGQAFITNCVIHHLWHVIPGAHFERMYGQDIEPHSYQLLASIADYKHWAGGHWTSSRGGQGVHSDAGGGHAHSGAAVYLADQFPAEYRNTLLTCNIHGNRLNRDRLNRHSSGYKAGREPDFLFANDDWFRGIAVHQGPGGSLFVCDWTDTGECHNYQVADQTNGRLYKVVFGQPAAPVGDLNKLTDQDLAKLQLDRDDWLVRHARRILQERAAADRLDGDVAEKSLRTIAFEHQDETRRLRGVWALHAMNRLTEEDILMALRDRGEHVRHWGVRLAVDANRPTDRVEDRLSALAKDDPSPHVRLALASALQQLPVDHRVEIAAGLVGHASDVSDAYLPLMLWYGVEPIAATHPETALRLAARATIPVVRTFTARRVVTADLKHLGSVIRTVVESQNSAVQRDLLAGARAALAGRRSLAAPDGWPEAYPRLLASADSGVRDESTLLGLIFGDDRAFASLRERATNPKIAAREREQALQALIQQGRPDLPGLLLTLLDDPAIRSSALRGLAAFAEPSTPARILALYPQLSAAEKADAVATLASRPAFARALLDAMEAGTVPPRDVSVFVARQIDGLKEESLRTRLTKVWGEVQPASKQRASLMNKYRQLLTPDDIRDGDRSRGRALYAANCASCHKLFGEGGDVGPELTGAQRSSLDYLLENVVDPNAVVPREYQVTVVLLANGRTINGIVVAETEKALSLRTPNEVVLVPKDEIEERLATKTSLMPEGLFDRLQPSELRDLVAYLAGPDQVPLPASAGR